MALAVKLVMSTFQTKELLCTHSFHKWYRIAGKLGGGKFGKLTVCEQECLVN